MKDGFGLFFKAPGYLTVVSIVFLVLLITISILPIVSILSQFVSPILSAGLIYACMRLDTEDQRKHSFLFIGFKQNLKSFLFLSLLYILGFIAIIVVIGIAGAVIVGFNQSSLDQLNQLSVPGNIPDPQFLLYLALAGLLGLLLMVPLFMGILYAPALIILNDLPARQAFSMSFKGCLKNMGALTVWSFLLIPVFILALIPLGLGLIVLPILISCTLYFSYNAIFLAKED